MLNIILLFLQISLLGYAKFLIYDNNTYVFFAIFGSLILEIVIAGPVNKKTKWICSKSMLSILKNAFLIQILLTHIENQHLYNIVFLGGISKIFKDFTQVLVIKKIDQIISKCYFIGIYTQIFSFYKILQIGSYIFLTGLFLQLELHTIELKDHYKVNSLVIVNISFILYGLQIILNLIEGFAYIKWALKKDQEQKQIKETKKNK